MRETMYRSLRLPKSLIDCVENEVDRSKLGYRSIAEFVAEAVREKLSNKVGVQK